MLQLLRFICRVFGLKLFFTFSRIVDERRSGSLFETAGIPVMLSWI